MSDAFHGYGSTYKVGDGASPEVFTAVAEVTSIQPGAMSTEAIDATHLTSANAHKEKIPGIKDTGVFTITGNYLPGNATQNGATRGLLKLWNDRTVFNAKLVLSDDDTTEWEHSGFVSNFAIGEVGNDDKVSFTAEITLSTQPTIPAVS